MNMKELTKVSKFLQELKLGSGLELDESNNTVSVPTMVGATETTVGKAGLVPAATPEEVDKVLLGNGTWGLVNRPDINASIGCKVFHFAANERDAVLPSGSLLTVPEYPVGSNAIHVYLDNGRCFLGQEYEEVGTAPALSTQIKLLIDLQTYHDLQGFVITAVIDPKDPSALQRIIALENRIVEADDVTTVNVSNMLVAKDIAIGGDASDLASTRGTFDTLTKGSVDCNTLTDQGVYAISLSGTVNGPGFSAKLVVFNGKNSKFTNQMALAAGAGTSGALRVACRSRNSESVWSPWSEMILSGRIGDGITVNNGIISVPEMQGATSAQAGTGGLVPPPLTADLGKALCADGNWIYPADIAIGNDQSNLASAKGFFYDNYVPWYAGTSADTYLISDFNEFERPGVYHIRWREGTEAEGVVVTQNSPNAGNGAGLWFDGILEVDTVSPCSYVSSYTRIQQKITVTNNSGTRVCRTYIRVQDVSSQHNWFPWRLWLNDTLLGDGFRITNGIISVPEYEGATTSSVGTSGLVPPATSAQVNAALHGNGEWKSILQSPSEVSANWVNYTPVYASGQNLHVAPSEGWVQVAAEAKNAATPYISLCSYKSTTPDSVATDTGSDKWDYELLSESTHLLRNRARLNLRVAKGTKFNLWFTDETNLTIILYRFYPCQSS